MNDVSAPLSLLQPMLDQVNRVVVGKKNVTRLAAACLLADGHLLLEDLPGVGKTTLATALARTTALDYQRIQFTSDMLPADILGVSIYSRHHERFDFHPGPIFSQIILADEINRATPKAQSALLEAMAERQVTIEGLTRDLPAPFFVIATQNPVDLAGAFPLPDSQLDRFLMRISIGYPDAAEERRLFTEPDRKHMLTDLKPVLDASKLLALQAKARQVHASEALLDYTQALVAATREARDLVSGLSPRGALALLSAARGWALLAERDHLVPEDLQSVFTPVTAHRLRLAPGLEQGATDICDRILEQTPIP